MSQYLGADYTFGELEIEIIGKVRTCEISMESYFKAIVDDFDAFANSIRNSSLLAIVNWLSTGCTGLPPPKNHTLFGKFGSLSVSVQFSEVSWRSIWISVISRFQ